MAIAIPQAATPVGLLKRSWNETAAVVGDVPTRGLVNSSAYARFVIGGIDARAGTAASNTSLEPTTVGIGSAAANVSEDTSAPREDELKTAAVRNAIDILVAEKASKRLLEEYYRLGSFRNRAANRALWKRNPNLAAMLLLGLSARDHDVERLADVSAILASLGRPATLATIHRLEAGTSLQPMFIEMALRALRWSEALTSADHERLEALLRRLFQHDDSDVREAAYQLAARQLPVNRATTLLREAVAAERDPELRDELAEIVDDIGG